MNGVLSNRYKIVTKLGQGGMGTVWLAEDILLDARKVAIKVLSSKFLNDSNAVLRLKKEAQVALQLSHPNLSAIRAFEIHDNSPYIVMDFVDGRTLAEYLKLHGPLSDFETFKIIEPLAKGLEYAHSKGIVHRDIKPSNIIIDKDGTPVLLDFGISDETRVASGHNPEVSGTLFYMSPEQLKGFRPHSSHDIYSLGATAYQCMKGHPPFYSGNIIEQILSTEPTKLGCECWFCNVVFFCITKDTKLRPRNAIQIADGEKRRRAFIRWALNKAEKLLKSDINGNEIAIRRLEFGAETCLTDLEKSETAEISLPYLQNGIHVEFKVTRDDVRKMSW